MHTALQSKFENSKQTIKGMKSDAVLLNSGRMSADSRSPTVGRQKLIVERY